LTSHIVPLTKHRSELGAFSTGNKLTAFGPVYTHATDLEYEAGNNVVTTYDEFKAACGRIQQQDSRDAINK